MFGPGNNIANNLKAKNFLGTLSIRNGLFLIAVQQVLLGISLYSVIHYLHPSLHKLAWLLFGVNALSGVLGFCGALKRNMVIESVYLVFYLGSIFLLFLTVLDMAELVHLLPKAPQIHDVSFASMRTGSLHKMSRLRPHIFMKQHEVPFDLPDDMLIDSIDGDLELEDDYDDPRREGHDHARHSREVHRGSSKALVATPPPTYRHTHTTEDDERKASEDNAIIDMFDTEFNHLSPAQGAGRRHEEHAHEHDLYHDHEVGPPQQRTHMDQLIADHNDLINGNSFTADATSGETAEPAKKTEMAVVKGTPASTPETLEAKEAVEEESAVERKSADKAAETEDNKEPSFYDAIPLVPHLGETEGETEEVAKEELPPETKDLSPEGVSEVVAIYKIQKRPLKMAAAGLMTVALLFNLYCFWVAVTFVLNKCTCLDELVSHPEQFTPLID